MEDFRWYVAQALPGLEATALHHIRRIPAIRDSFAAPRSKDGRASLYPGYIFVELDGFDFAAAVNRTRGVRKLLPVHSERPLPLPRGFVEGLREAVGRGDYDERSEAERLLRFVPQEEVTMISGPFRDHHGRFLRYHKGAGVVLFVLLRREMEVLIPLHQLAAVGGYRSGPESRSVAA